MNPQITNLSKTLADNYASGSERVLDAVLDGNRKIVDVAVSTADQLVDQLPAEIVNRFPTPADTGARYLEFVERAVEVNREWNDRIVALLTPDTPAAPAPVKKAPAKRAAAKRPAKKAAAKRSPAKKAAATA
jgi:hypothetical protein